MMNDRNDQPKPEKLEWKTPELTDMGANLESVMKSFAIGKDGAGGKTTSAS